MIKTTDISGVWRFAFDRAKGYNDTIDMPNTTSAAQKGEYNGRSETGFLTDTYKYEGNAWFKKSVQLQCCNRAVLFLERTRITEVFIDGASLGVQDSLCAAHIYDVTRFCDGHEHDIEICVSNVGYKTGGGHMTSQDTQTNWLGITGKMEIRYFGRSYADNIRITGDTERRRFIVTADIYGDEPESAMVSADDGDNTFNAGAVVIGSELYAEIPLGNSAKLWSEFSPTLYTVKIEIDGDVQTFTAGLRSLTCSKDKFLINGKKTFLRGKHDGMIFPLTGYAPTDTESWLRVMGIAKKYGINHYRFHTCCPPEAAFEAADILGIYMEPELPFWGTIQAQGEEGFNREEQEYLINEGLNMLRCFGNHPSFCMLSMGNELWGDPKRINEIIGILKAYDNRPLYTQGSNNFQFFPNAVPNDDFFVGVRLSSSRLIRGSYAMCDAPLGHVQTDEPSTMKDYDDAILGSTESGDAGNTGDGTISIQYGTGVKKVKASKAADGFYPQIPIVTHEIGQYETYPDFREIAKYTGSIKAKNFETFRQWLDEKGLLHLADDYFRASGKLAMLCYKEELEAVMRSRLLAGCQILDIQDFSGQGTALVGVLDAFMDSKGLITEEEWRGFFSQTVILARFAKYVYTPGERFSADIQLTDFGAVSCAGKKLCWQLGECSGSLVIPQYENYADIGRIEASIPNTAGRLEFRLWIEGSDIQNHYSLDIVRDVKNVDYSGCIVKPQLDKEAEDALKNGRTVIINRIPDEHSSIEGFYCTDFWCYPMFRSISQSMGKPLPTGTMGLLIDNTHPALSGFVSQTHSTPMWYKPVTCSRSEILDGQSDGKRVIVRTIDNFERNHDLALIYEYDMHAGKVIVCGAEFAELEKSPEGRALVQSLVDYAKQN